MESKLTNGKWTYETPRKRLHQQQLLQKRSNLFHHRFADDLAKNYCMVRTPHGQVEGYCISTFRGVTSFTHTVERRILLLGTVYLHLRTTSISAFSVFALIEASFFCCSDMRFVTNRYLTPSKPSPHKWWRIRATSRQNPLSIKREPQKTWPFNGGIIMFSLGILKVMCLSFCVARKTDLLAQDPPLFGHGRTLSRCGYGPPNLKKNLRYQTNKTCNFTWPSLEVYWYIWYMERCFTMPHPHPG